MCRVGTTVFSTRVSTRPASELAVDRPVGSARRWWWLCCWCLAVLLLAPAGGARAEQPQLLQQQLHRSSEGLYLTVRLGLSASRAVEDVLLRGVPLYFVWQADVYRQRWYWSDKRVAGAQRTLRLAYQPLTRRWRLSLANGVAGSTGASLQYALHQNYDSLDDALAVIGRVTRWRITDSGELDPGARHRVEWLMQLELSLLPRPFQIGVANQPAWELSVTRRLRVPDAADDAPASEGPASASATDQIADENAVRPALNGEKVESTAPGRQE